MSDNPFRDVRLQSVAIRDLAYETLKEAIVQLKLPPGQRLREEHLTRQLNISRTPLREAFQALERDGFIVRLPSGGVQVAPLSVDDLHNLYDIRRALEGLAAREAASRGTAADWVEAERANADMLFFGERGRLNEAYDAGRQFHSVIYSASGNPRLSDMLNHLMQQLTRYRYFSVAHRFREAHADHVQILESLRCRRAARADAASQHHVETEYRILMETLQPLNTEDPQKEVDP